MCCKRAIPAGDFVCSGAVYARVRIIHQPFHICDRALRCKVRAVQLRIATVRCIKWQSKFYWIRPSGKDGNQERDGKHISTLPLRANHLIRIGSLLGGAVFGDDSHIKYLESSPSHRNRFDTGLVRTEIALIVARRIDCVSSLLGCNVATTPTQSQVNGIGWDAWRRAGVFSHTLAALVLAEHSPPRTK